MAHTFEITITGKSELYKYEISTTFNERLRRILGEERFDLKFSTSFDNLWERVWLLKILGCQVHRILWSLILSTGSLASDQKRFMRRFCMAKPLCIILYVTLSVCARVSLSVWSISSLSLYLSRSVYLYLFSSQIFPQISDSERIY